MASYSINVNGEKRTVDVSPDTPLLWVLRDSLGLVGTKYGCGIAQCGACTVHLNGTAVRSCSLPISVVKEGKVTTIEGLATEKQLHPMQEAFIKHDSMQCGYCTSGQIMSAITCIRGGHANSRQEIKDYMEGNICRCGAYQNIVDAIIDLKQSGKTV